VRRGRCLILTALVPLLVGLSMLAVHSSAQTDPPAPCGSPRVGEVAPADPAVHPVPPAPLAGATPACPASGLGVTRSLHDPAADAVHALTVPDMTQVIPSREGD
jgi:hypothetical protein